MPLPEKVMAALRERDRVSLEISWTGGEAFTIPAGQALEPDGLRVYYMLGYLEELYHARPSAAGDKTNPETGGVWEITAPEPAANTAPPAFTAEDAGLAAAPEQAREPGEQAEKAAFTPAAPDAAAGGTAENSIAWLAALLLLAIAVGGIWYWKHRKA